MKKRLFLLLCFVLQCALLFEASAQTQVYQIVRGRQNVIVGGRTVARVYYKQVLRDVSKYPITTLGDSLFKIDYNAGLLTPINKVSGVSWASARITYVEAKQHLEVEAAGAPMQLKFERYDNAALAGSNPDGVPLQSGIFYSPGPLSGQGDYTQQWKFGKKPDGTGGIPAVTLKLTFRNLSTNETFVHYVTPIDRASRTQLFVAGTTSTTTTPPATQTLASAYSYDAGNGSYTAYLAATDASTYEVLMTPLSGQSTPPAATWRTMAPLSSPVTVASTSFNRSYLYLPAFAGGTPLQQGNWRQDIRKVGTTTIIASGVVTLGPSNASGLITAGATPAVSCDYTVAANTISSACNQAVQLTALTSGTGATGLSYSWNINGVNRTGQTVSITSPSTVGTYSYSVTTSKAGCSDKTAVATLNVTSCQQNLQAYNYGYVFGNSFTFAGSFGAWPRANGMAASSLANDYAHKLQDILRTKNPAFQLYIDNQGSPWEGDTYSYLDGNYDYTNRITNSLNYAFSNNPPKFDLIILSIGENIRDDTFDQTKYFAGLDSVINRLPKASSFTVVLRGAFWSGHTASTAGAQAYATARGYKFVSFADRVEYPAYHATEFDGIDAGIAHHWNDAGHLEIATRLAAALTGTTVTPPTTTTATTTPGYGNVYASNSTYQPLANNTTTGSNEAHGEYNRVYIQAPSNGIKYGVNLRLGGCADYLSHPSWYGGKNSINSPIYGQIGSDGYPDGNVDAGRDLDIGTYEFPHGGPDPAKQYVDAATGRSSRGIGYNPITGGGEGTNPSYSQLITLYRDNNQIYVRTRPNQWELYGVKANVWFDKWVSFDPSDNSAVRVHGRIINFRNDSYSNHFPTSDRTHEVPYGMFTAEFDQIWYNQGGQPYVGSWTGRSQSECNGCGATAFYASEPCVAVIRSSDGKGYGMYTPMSARYGHNNDRRGYTFSYDWEMPVFYLSSSPYLIIDKNGVYDYDYSIKFGTKDEIRTWCLAQPRWPGTFDYTFNSRSRYNLFYHNCGDQLENNITDGLIIKPLFDNENSGRDMKINVQETWINGRTVKHIYIRGAFTGPSNSMAIVFKKSGQSNINTEYYHNVTIQNDGVERTYDIDMSGDANWNDQDIVTWGLSYAPSYPTVDSSTQWIIKRISSTSFEVAWWQVVLLLSLASGTMIHRRKRKAKDYTMRGAIKQIDNEWNADSSRCRRCGTGQLRLCQKEPWHEVYRCPKCGSIHDYVMGDHMGGTGDTLTYEA